LSFNGMENLGRNWEKTVGAARRLAVRESGGEWVGGGRAWDQAA
jgi:hypothetical protein